MPSSPLLLLNFHRHRRCRRCRHRRLGLISPSTTTTHVKYYREHILPVTRRLHIYLTACIYVYMYEYMYDMRVYNVYVCVLYYTSNFVSTILHTIFLLCHPDAHRHKKKHILHRLVNS